MCWRNGIWHPCVKIASPANTFAIISSVQRGVAQAALRPPYGARRQHLHEGWAGEGKLQVLWPAFLQGLLHYHNVVREHDGCGVNWHLWCEGETFSVSETVTFFLSVFLFLCLSLILFFFLYQCWSEDHRNQHKVIIKTRMYQDRDKTNALRSWDQIKTKTKAGWIPHWPTHDKMWNMETIATPQIDLKDPHTAL